MVVSFRGDVQHPVPLKAGTDGPLSDKGEPHEDDRLVCEAELATADGRKKELHIDARTGRIEKIKND